ncbi:Transcription elongation factor GreA, partial [Bienertia sinuspersici]
EEEDEIHIPDEELECQVNLDLVRKLFTQNAFNIEAMKLVLRASSKPTKGMVVREIDKNLFVFQFFCLTDREKNSSYCFGNKLGKYLGFNEANILGWCKYMIIRVRLNVNKPLPRGSTMKIGGEKIWVDFRIERLPGFLLCMWVFGAQHEGV